MIKNLGVIINVQRLHNISKYSKILIFWAFKKTGFLARNIPDFMTLL